MSCRSCGCSCRGRTGPTGPSGGGTGSTGPTGPSSGPTGPAGPTGDAPVADDIARTVPGGPIDRVVGQYGVSYDLTVPDQTAPPVGGTWAYNEVGSNTYKPEKPVMPGHYNVEDYGAIPDFDPLNPGAATDNLPFFNATLAAMAADGLGGVLIAHGHFFLNGTWTINQTVSIRGLGHGEAQDIIGRTSPGTWLVFPTDCDGIHFNVPGFPIPTAEASQLRDVTVSCYFDRGSPVFPDTAAIPPNGHTGNGLRINVPMQIYDCEVVNFAGHGVLISAGVGGISDHGNADNTVIQNLTTGGNGGSGIYTIGEDVGACLFTSIYIVANWGWGIWDNSLAGNTYIQCDGQGNLGENDPGVCKFSVDSRNHDYKTGEAFEGFPPVPTTFFGCYTEAADNSLNEGSGAIGGLLGESPGLCSRFAYACGANGTANSAPFKYICGQVVKGLRIEMGGGATFPYVGHSYVSFGESPQAAVNFLLNPYNTNVFGGWMSYTWGVGVGFGDIIRIPTQGATGRREFQAPWFPHGMMLGGGNAGATGLTASMHLTADVPPVTLDGSGSADGWTYDQGDIIWAKTATIGQPVGQVCVVAGTKSTLNGGLTTGDILNTTFLLTVNSTTGLLVNSYITIAGVTGVKQITNITGLVVTIDVAADATVVGAAIAYSPPSFGTFGVIS
jgi:hypothetical protein